MARSFIAVGLLLTMVALAGCPLGDTPRLGVYPTAFNFNVHDDTRQFQLYNQGGGELTWEIGNMPAWIHLDPSGTGVTTTNQTDFTITVDRAGLANGSHTGEFLISSNGGSQMVTVSLTVVPVPKLDVALDAIDFGQGSTASIEICNPGTGDLDWAIAGPTWLSADPANGRLEPDDCVTVELAVNRSGQSPGDHSDTLAITSNGGNAQIDVSMEVPPVVVSPAVINFGRTLSAATATISNTANQDHTFTISNGYPAWIAEVTPVSGTVPAGGQVAVTIRVNRAILQSGDFTGLLTVQSPGGTGEVRLRIEGPRPVLAVTPTELQFFDADFNAEGIGTNTISVRNSGDGTLAWSVVSDLPPWLSADPMAGTVAAGSSPVTVSVDRTLIAPNRDEDAVAHLTVRSVVGNATQTAVVTIRARVLPPTLTATPLSMDFGTRQSQKLLAIWNSGVGSVNWNIDTAAFPAWLSLSATNGTATGSQTDPVLVIIDRNDLPPLAGGYAYTFQITGEDGDGAALQTLSVRVSMNVAEVPTISIDTGVDAQGVPNVDEFGIPFLPFGTRTSLLTFRVSNVGTGTLNWAINTAMLPAWVTSVSPSQESLDPGEQVVVTVMVSRANLSFGSVQHALVLASNDPNNREQPVRLEMQIPKRIRIGAKPQQLTFGLFDLTSFVEGANLGDPGSVLNFVIESNKPWLFFYPETGTSIGTGLEVKDWRPINIAIDRSNLNDTGSVGELTIRAFETEENGTRVFLEDVAPVVVRIAVEAAELTFETAEARLRIPSLARYILTMRDIRYQSVPLARETIEDYTDNFVIFQDAVAVEATESEQFLKSGTGSSGANLKTNLIIALDYSGSMVDAARNVEDPLIAAAADPLQEAYQRSVSRLLEELPANYRIALMEFHDRGQTTRMVRGIDFDGDGLIAPDELPFVPPDPEEENRYFIDENDFTTDRETLLARLRSIGPSVEDHGSSDVLLAAHEAATRIVHEDAGYDRHPFDDADVRVIIFISDGRLTTPPGEIDDAIDSLAELKVRFLPIGWGQNVNHEPLARLAAGTGGHYYSCRGAPSGSVFDAFGRPVRLPVFSELMDHAATDDVAVDPCDQSIPKDLKSQVVFNFVSLNEERTVKTRIEAAFDNPNDDEGTCLPDQGPISGLFEQEHNFDEIVGDVRLGQISMRTDGNASGSADVRVRLEYAPRNIRKFEFTVEAPEPFSVSQIPFDDGGILEDWIPAVTNPVGETMVGTYRFDAPEGTTMRYADFGDMLNVHFNNAVVEFRLLLTVNNEIYLEDLEPKYFIYPDSIPVRLGEFLAPAFPTPSFRLPGDPYGFDYFNLGTVITTFDIELRNVGGNFPYPADPFFDCLYHWKATVGSELAAKPLEGRINSTIDTIPDTDPDFDGLDVVKVTPNRLLAPGPYENTIAFEYDPVCDELRNLSLPRKVIRIEWRVAEAVVGVESDDFVDPNVPAPELNFGDSAGGITQLTFDVVNLGQSVLRWDIDTASLPPWLSVAPTAGLAPSAASTVVVTVDRSLINPADPPPARYVIDIKAENAFTERPLPEASVVVTVFP